MYVDANGNQFESYDDACYYYGADTPAQIEAEQKAIALEEHEEWCRARIVDGYERICSSCRRNSR